MSFNRSKEILFTRNKDVDTAYFMFGRFNPPTIGHRTAFEQLVKEAGKVEADVYVFVSSTKNSDNPLSVTQKIHFLEKLFGGRGVRFINTTTCPLKISGIPCKSPFQAVKRLKEMGYKNLTMYVGDDREEGFSVITEYYPDIRVTTGENEEKGKRKEGISATVVRAAARAAAQAANKNRNAYVTYVTKVIEKTGLTEKNAKKLIAEIKNANEKGYPSKYSIAQASKKSRQAQTSKKSRKASSRSRSPTKKRSTSRSRGGYQTRKSKK